MVFVNANVRRVYMEDKISNEYDEKTCGSVVFTCDDNVKKYLLIENRDSRHIGFPKGHVENNETEAQTAKREVFEETGLTIEIDMSTRQEYTYKNDNDVIKNCVYFCSEFVNSEIKIQEKEVSRYWLADFNEAMKLLNYPQDKVILEKADKMYD